MGNPCTPAKIDREAAANHVFSEVSTVDSWRLSLCCQYYIMQKIWIVPGFYL